MEFEIARMAPEHQARRGFVHYTAWRETYRGLMPDAYLEAQTLEKRVEQAALFPHNTFVALSGGQVIGFACCCERAREFVGRPKASEIAALYVLRAFQSQGAGRALLRACLDVLPRARTLFCAICLPLPLYLGEIFFLTNAGRCGLISLNR